MTESDFIQSYNEYADALFRHCFFRTSDRDLAKDLTQETYIKTWQAIQKGQQIENIRAFLYKVANNLIIDHYRKKKEISLDSLQEKGLDFVKEDKGGVDIADMQSVLRELRKLPEKYRRVVTMRYIDDMSPKDIAAILNETENAVSVKINRGMKQIRKNLYAE